MTPEGYFFELGLYAGAVLIFGCLFLWAILAIARDRSAILLFCVVALAQVGYVAFVVSGFRTENRALQQILGELPQKQEEWTSRMARFSMDPVFEMCDGKRQLSTAELLELEAEAKAAQAEVQVVKAEMVQWEDQAESRLAKVNRKGAHDFRLGLDSRQAESDEIMKLMKSYYAEVQELIRFLIDRQHKYRVTTEGLQFAREEDVQKFNDELSTIESHRKQLGELGQKAQREIKKLPVSR